MPKRKPQLISSMVFFLWLCHSLLAACGETSQLSPTVPNQSPTTSVEGNQTRSPSTAPASPLSTGGPTNSPGLPVTSQANKGLLPPYLLDLPTLQVVKNKISAHDPSFEPALKSLLINANQLLKEAPLSVTDKNQLPPSGDKHDYLSLADYWWPDPAKADGLPYINRDGKVNPETATVSDKSNLNKMISSVHTLSLAYYFSDNEAYAQKAVLSLRKWFLDKTSRMNPNLNYAQLIKGRAGDEVRGGGIIDSRNLVEVVDGLGLLNKSPALTTEDRQGLKEWFSQYLDWLLNSPNGQAEAAAQNNHGTYYDVQVTTLALFLKRDELAHQVLEESKHKRIARQIESDGRQILELKRTKSWDYSVFNLEALFNLATVGTKLNIDLWQYQTEDGRSLLKALDYLLPFGLGQAQWGYPQITPFNPQILSNPLLQAGVNYHEPKYWEESVKLEGTEAFSSQFNLLYLKP